MHIVYHLRSESLDLCCSGFSYEAIRTMNNNKNVFEASMSFQRGGSFTMNDRDEQFLRSSSLLSSDTVMTKWSPDTFCIA